MAVILDKCTAVSFIIYLSYWFR